MMTSKPFLERGKKVVDSSGQERTFRAHTAWVVCFQTRLVINYDKQPLQT